MKSFLRILLLTILILSASTPENGQAEDSPITPTLPYPQDIRFENITAGDVTALNHPNPVENLLGAQGWVKQADILILTDERGEYPLGLYLEILEDEYKAWTIDNVIAPELAQQFIPSQETAPNLGFSDSAFWIRFRVRNETNETTDWQLAIQRTTNLFFTDVYIPAPDQQSFIVTKTGTYLPFRTRDVKVTQYVFNIPLQPGAEQTIHIRIQSDGLISVPLTLWSSDALAQRHRVELVLLGIFYGALLITIGYNTFLYLILRDISYLYYVLFITCFLLQILSGDGMAQQYLLPNAVGWNAYANPLFYILGIAFALKFAGSFLMTRVNRPKLHKLINILFIICLVTAISLPFGGLKVLNAALFILVIVSILTMIVVGFIVLRQGYRPARYYFPGWLIFFVTAIMIPLLGVNLLPNNLITSQSYRFGLIALVFLLSVALADRINTIRREREKAQAELIRKKQETLELREAQTTVITEERIRLARDLHDSTTQALYSALLFSETGKKLTHRGDQEGAEYYQSRVSTVIQQALKEMRLLVFELRPLVLDQADLVGALQMRMDAVERRSGIEARLQADDLPSLPAKMSENLYRIAQEALNNALKHAQAETVTVHLQFEGNLLTLEVVDNGQGYDVEGAVQSGGMGLVNMRERTEEIGGDLKIDSIPGEGTSVIVKIPLEKLN